MKKFLKIFAMVVIALVTLCSLVACKNSAGGSGGNGSSVIIEFGQWPQTIKADGVTVTESDDNKRVVGMFTYYKGDDGNWYCKVKENAYGTEAQYKYSNGNQVQQEGANSFKWFKVEPIKWRVLTNDYNGKKLLFAESGLYANVPYYDNINGRTISIGGSNITIYSNNYEHSLIRAWLNGLNFQLDNASNSDHNGKGFLQTAFTAEEQEKIAETVVDNSEASTNPASNPNEWNNGKNEYACGNTTDKIFLLSEKEITTSGYGFAEHDQYGAGNARIRKPTDFALANYAYKNSDAAYGGWFFLRSPPSNYRNLARHVNAGGDARNGYGVNHSDGVVAPALCID